ncbi:motility associated factor glycosyltransferase family protein [Pseudoalteromonas phenolica]|uniref:motility associated factor glycosyltransferase family protein n=1 Tax=Pseudoalteromonas phenolica TaxID=161398 RepID=UPI00110B7645|nr:6-hydroxymethylpterin diphosphokinase MptE-like protein [Pseudoalteromonas phenolica]TMO57471.1 septum formation inhibitor Maf [Pseudoalteromonas phenolica]
MADGLFKEQLDSLDKKLSETVKLKELENLFAQDANIRFEKNLQSFEKYYPDIAEAIKNFKTDSLALHVCEDGDANIIEKSTGVALYSDHPRKQSHEQVEKNYSSPTFCTVKYGQLFTPDEGDERIHSRYMSLLNKKISDTRESDSEGSFELNFLPNTFPASMIFGIGLGYHLEKLFDEVTFNYSFIVEPNFELFFASLFCIEWDKIIAKVDESNGCLFLYLGTTYSEFFDDLNKTIEDIGAYSIAKTFCYQHYPDININKTIDDFFKNYFRLLNGFGFYDDAVVSLGHTLSHISKKSNFWTGAEAFVEKTDSCPAFVVGNGPSLDASIEFLKSNQDKGIIIAAGTALNSLLKVGIKPDFHVQIERPRRNYDILLDTTDKNILKEINLLTTNVLYPETTSLYGWSGLALKGNEAGTDYYVLSRLFYGMQFQNIIPFSNPLVANTAASFAASLGFDEVYLFGVDNGVPDSGEHHSKHSIYESGKYKLIEGYRHRVKGNLGGELNSNDLYLVSKYQLESLARVSPEVNFYNVGEGAELKGFYPLEEDKVLISQTPLNKEKVINRVKQCFSDEIPDDKGQVVLDMQRFDVISEHILSISEEPFSTREECLDLLNRQARYVYSLKKTRFSHFYFIFKGSLLYYHCPLITSLYYYQDSSKSLELTNQLISLWNSYLKEIIADFKKNYNSNCDWKFV